MVDAYRALKLLLVKLTVKFDSMYLPDMYRGAIVEVFEDTYAELGLSLDEPQENTAAARLDELDDILRQAEDIAHGDVGDLVTRARVALHDLKKS